MKYTHTITFLVDLGSSLKDNPLLFQGLLRREVNVIADIDTSGWGPEHNLDDCIDKLRAHCRSVMRSRFPSAEIISERTERN